MPLSPDLYERIDPEDDLLAANAGPCALAHVNATYATTTRDFVFECETEEYETQRVTVYAYGRNVGRLYWTGTTVAEPGDTAQAIVSRCRKNRTEAQGFRLPRFR